jgi:hypothetical protein
VLLSIQRPKFARKEALALRITSFVPAGQETPRQEVTLSLRNGRSGRNNLFPKAKIASQTSELGEGFAMTRLICSSLCASPVRKPRDLAAREKRARDARDGDREPCASVLCLVLQFCSPPVPISPRCLPSGGTMQNMAK